MEEVKTIRLFLIFGYFYACESLYSYVLLPDGKPTVRVGEAADIPVNYAAKGTYSNEINSTGWAFLEVMTSKKCADDVQAFSAGFLEGYLTRDLIWMHWQNMLRGYCYNKIHVCALIEKFVDANEGYVNRMVDQNPKDPYWYQMKLYYIQMEGVAAGYQAATRNIYEVLTVRDISWINMLGDLDELALALTLPKSSPDGLLFDEHCTGLVKLLPGFEDLYVAHTTWNSYQSMLRVQKMYVLHYHMHPGSKRLIPGYKMSMSSYPAFVQILEYVRVMIANRLARDGHEWTSIFRRHNSGTYNNQWYIVDYNKFRARGKHTKGRVARGLLWVVETIPGYTEARDLTDLLIRQSYFPSYNIPFFPRVFNMSGGHVRIALFGDWFGYDTNPRALILKQKQAKIHNLRDMYETMRHSDFKNDPLSRCAACRPPYSACNAIAARNDLNPANGTYPFRALGHRSHGGTDAKVTSSALMRKYLFVAVSSPTHNISRGIPPFRWSEFDLGTTISHIGHPDLWMFSPLVHSWEWA